MAEMRSIPGEFLQALLDGEVPPDAINAFNKLGLTIPWKGPDLRFADPETLAPLFAHPALRRIQHLAMSEGASESLEAVLGWIEPGCLETLTIRPRAARDHRAVRLHRRSGGAGDLAAPVAGGPAPDRGHS